MMTDQLHALKYVTDTLSTARRDQLPQVIPALITHVSNCSEVLCLKASSPQTAASASSLVHKIRTQISSLLQDKSLQGRWAAVVLVKTIIESVIHHREGWEFLRTSTAWIRGLLAVLGKPDPLPTKTIAIITLTRIFLLTHGQPSLTREITTPHLASFISACLNSITTKSSENGSRTLDQAEPLIETILQCLIRLLPNHPAIFRPFSNQIRSLISPLIAPTPSTTYSNSDVYLHASSQQASRLARYLHALLPLCASKTGASEEWRKYVSIIIKQTNQTANRAFRAVHENGYSDREEILPEPADQIEDDLMLIGWHGVAAGCERIGGLLLLLSAYLNTKGNMNYQIPVRAIHETTERLLSVTRPQSVVAGARAEGINRQVSREERESLYMMLPQVHIATLEVLSSMVRRMSLLSFSVAEDLLEQIAWMVQRSSPTSELRSTVYRVAEQIITMIGTSVIPETSTSISIVVRMACKDLILESKASNEMKLHSKGKTSKSHYNADSFMSTTSIAPTRLVGLQKHQGSALHFLCAALLRLPAHALSSVRSDIDRVAVLLQDRILQLTSILNPQVGLRHQNVNLTPFLSKSHDPLAEALIHRRLGTVTSREEVQDDISAELERDGPPMEPELTIAPSNSNSFSSPQITHRSEVHEVPDPMQDLDSVTTKRAAECVVVGDTDIQSDTIEHANKKPRLDHEQEERTHHDISISNNTENDVDPNTATISTEAPIKEDTIMDPATVNSDSDDSFEIPEIVIDFDESEDEEDD